MVNKCVSSQLKGKGAGLWFDIKSEDLSSDFTFIPWSPDLLICVPFLN